MTRRRGLLAGAAVLVALVVILVLSDPTEDRYNLPPLDPRGTGPDGTAALVELLRAEGSTVRLGGLATGDDDVVIALADRLGGEPAADLRAWVRAGGTLVVADPDAALAPTTVDGFPVDVDEPTDCELSALADLDRLDPGLPAEFATEPESSSCFIGPSSDGRDAAAIDVRTFGAGLVVAVSSPLPLTNEALDRGDNAVLATALVAPGEGRRVRVLDPNRFVGDVDEVGDGTVRGALPRRGSEALSQLLVAFVAWALISGRRLGQPVTEELPVPLPASDLVLASGRLLDRNGDVSDAAERLRRRARRDMGVSIGLGPDPPPGELADALRARAGIDTELVHRALLAPVVDEAALVATSARLDRLRRDLYQ